MKTRLLFLSVAATSLVFVSGASAAVRTYQVTGPVLEVTDDHVVVQKGQDKWELARDASTKVTGELKVGAKVTIEYRMNAASVTVAAEGAAKKPAAKKP